MNRLLERFSLADHERELRRNDQLRAAAPEVQREHLNQTYVAMHKRIRILGTRLPKSFLPRASETAAGLTTNRLAFGVTIPAHAAAIGSAFCFAWSTLGRLGWSGQSFK